MTGISAVGTQIGLLVMLFPVLASTLLSLAAAASNATAKGAVVAEKGLQDMPTDKIVGLLLTGRIYWDSLRNIYIPAVLFSG